MKDSNTELKSEITKTGKETKTTVVVKKFFVDHFIAGVSGFTVFFFSQFLLIFSPLSLILINQLMLICLLY
ncbi:MAG: hypothetical protein H6613_00625 [Ignavibacteriales bacterium]|nr:hypothetical protein [Ignavibacteriales bacterium]